MKKKILNKKVDKKLFGKMANSTKLINIKPVVARGGFRF